MILSGNNSATYSFDEPYFKSPQNLKVAPRPKHFDVVFQDIYSTNESTTVPPTTRAVVTTTPTTTTAKSTVRMSRPKRFYDDVTGSAVDQTSAVFKASTDAVFTQTNTYTSPVAGNQNDTVYTTAEPSADDSLIQCVKAYIYQIYDLDRERQDTHYLTINTESFDFLVSLFSELI